MKLARATTVGTLLLAGCIGLLHAADEATDAAAIAGGTGLIIAGALLGLTFLAWRWRAGFAYSTPVLAADMDNSDVYAEIAAFEHVSIAATFEDAAAV